MIILHGIPNCDTVKKAKNRLVVDTAWSLNFGILKNRGRLKRKSAIRGWNEVPLATLLNKRGTSWRKLDGRNTAKVLSSTAEAVKLMVRNAEPDQASRIECGGRVYVGFSEETYDGIFNRQALCRQG